MRMTRRESIIAAAHRAEMEGGVRLIDSIVCRAYRSTQLLENSPPDGGRGVGTCIRWSCNQPATVLIQTRNLGLRPIPYESAPSRSPPTTNLQRTLFVIGSVTIRSDSPDSSTFQPVGAYLTGMAGESNTTTGLRPR